MRKWIRGILFIFLLALVMVIITSNNKIALAVTSSRAMAETTIEKHTTGNDTNNMTPIQKAIRDTNVFGASVVYSDGEYEIWKNNQKVGSFDLTGVIINKQYRNLAEILALDLGFDATREELKSLVDQILYPKGTLFESNVESCFISGGDALDYINISLTPKEEFPTPSTKVTKTLNDIQSAGYTIKLGYDGSYNIFKNGEFIGNFYPGEHLTSGISPQFVEVNRKYSKLFVKIALDMGYTNPNRLETTVNQVMNEIKNQHGISKKNNVSYDGITLIVYFYDGMN